MLTIPALSRIWTRHHSLITGMQKFFPCVNHLQQYFIFQQTEFVTQEIPTKWWFEFRILGHHKMIQWWCECPPVHPQYSFFITVGVILQTYPVSVLIPFLFCVMTIPDSRFANSHRAEQACVFWERCVSFPQIKRHLWGISGSQTNGYIFWCLITIHQDCGTLGYYCRDNRP